MDNLFCGKLVSSTSQWRKSAPPACPVPLREDVSEFDSGDGDQHSGIG